MRSTGRVGVASVVAGIAAGSLLGVVIFKRPAA
jgi:hypothetical protein